MTDDQKAQPGWYADPFGRHEKRQWDGEGWTSSVSDGGTQAIDAPSGSKPKPTFTFTSNDHRGVSSQGRLEPPRFGADRLIWIFGNAVAGVLAALGAFLPWIVATANTGTLSLSRNGFQLGANLSLSPEGIFAVVGGVVLVTTSVVVFAKERYPRWLFGLPIVCGVVILQQVVPDLTDIHSEFASFHSATFTSGVGIWLVIVGAAIGIASPLASITAAKVISTRSSTMAPYPTIS